MNLVLLAFLVGGLLAIVYFVYPYMKSHTSNPVLYTCLLVGGVLAIQYVFSKNNVGVAGQFFIQDLLKSILGR